jgi:hypothetical protein
VVARLVLVGFDYAAPGSAVPVLWPAGLLQSSGSALNLTDVRLVTSSPDVFSAWLRFFTGDSKVAFWTVRLQLDAAWYMCYCSCCQQGMDMLAQLMKLTAAVIARLQAQLVL